MANQGLKNSVWVGTEAGVITTNQVRIQAIIFKGSTAGDGVTISDGSNTNELITMSIGVNSGTEILSFGGRGKIFPDGLYLHAISSSCVVDVFPEQSII